MYSDKVMDHFQHPRNVGKMEHPDGLGKEGNPVCGDVMELAIRVKDDVIEGSTVPDIWLLCGHSDIIDDHRDGQRQNA